MLLDKYISQHGKGTLTRLSNATGIDRTLLWRYKDRRTVPSYANARLIEGATEGQVTVAELCAMRRKRPRRKANEPKGVAS